MNWTVLKIGLTLVIVQAILAWFDNHLDRGQVLASRRPQDYSFFEHPIWVIDTALSYLAAYLEPRFSFDISSKSGMAVTVVSLFVVIFMMRSWRKDGVKIGDHCTHGGVDAWAGDVHSVFFFGMVWFFLQIYLGLTTPVATPTQLFWLSVFFTVFFPMGVAKFSSRWHWTKEAVVQVAGLGAGVWTVTAVRYFLYV